jgi:hypothetical protein
MAMGYGGYGGSFGPAFSGDFGGYYQDIGDVTAAGGLSTAGVTTYNSDGTPIETVVVKADGLTAQQVLNDGAYLSGATAIACGLLIVVAAPEVVIPLAIAGAAAAAVSATFSWAEGL